MKLKDLLDRIGEPEKIDGLSPRWGESEKSGQICRSFLEDSNVRDNAEYCGLDAETVSALRNTAGTVRNSEELARLARHICWDIFERTGDEPANQELWPTLTNNTSVQGSQFYLLVATAFAPMLRQAHSKRGLPEEVSRETADQVSCFAGNHRRGEKGRIGIYNSQLVWLRNYIFSFYVRLGRFEYWSKPFNERIVVCRRKGSSDTAVFAPDGMNFDRQDFALEQSSTAPELVWSSTLRIADGQISGHRIHPDGRTERQISGIALDQWEIVLQNGSDVLDMHIPAGGGMSEELCRESFDRAREFFRRWMPEKTHSAITCSSWIFSPNLPEIVPETSNLLKLQRMVHLFPVHSRAIEGLWFIFLQTPFDIVTAPRETSLQRQVISYLQKGGRMRSGGMFFLI